MMADTPKPEINWPEQNSEFESALSSAPADTSRGEFRSTFNSAKEQKNALPTPPKFITIENRIPSKFLENGIEICLCGHPVSGHVLNAVSRETTCKHRNLGCPCRSLVPILKATDGKPFHFITTGPFGLHALSKGIKKLINSHQTFIWIGGIDICVHCFKSLDGRNPISMGISGKVTYYAGGISILVCDSCKENISLKIYTLKPSKSTNPLIH